MASEKKITTKKKKLADTRFKKGVSGNPSGRPKGSKNRSTAIREAIEAEMVGEMEHMALNTIKKTYELAMEGDTACLKMLMDRMLPVTRPDEKNKGKDKSKVIINVSMLPEKPSKDVTKEGATLTLEDGEVVSEDG